MKPPYRDQLDAAARIHVPDEIDLFPRISAQIRARTFSGVLRARPLLAVLIVLLGLTLLTGAVYAVGRGLGYIPGIGLVEDGATLRSLAQPVAITREGITLTVTQALASGDKTVVVYRVEGIPESALAAEYSEGQTPPPTCQPQDSLRLPDNRTLVAAASQGGGWGLGYEFRLTYPPLPSDVTQASLIIPCLLGTTPGAAPEGWQIPLAFVPAPPDLAILPVVDISPTPAATAAPNAPLTGTPEPAPISIEQVITLADGYILIGSFHSIDLDIGLVTSPDAWDVRIRDAQGLAVAFDYTHDIDLPAWDEHTTSWAYQIQGKSHAWPLTISLETLEATIPDAEAAFTFDTGSNPQPGDQWTLDQELQIKSHRLTVLTATRTSDGYAFAFSGEPGLSGVSLDISGPDVHSAPAGGGGGGAGDGNFQTSVAYSGSVPQGKLTVTVSNLSLSVRGPWSIDWQPQDAASLPAPTPPTASAACVTDESWAQALAAGPSPLPAGLPGKLVTFGPNVDGSAYGVRVLDLAGRTDVFIGAGSWPVVSPDGTRIVTTGDRGLAVYDISTGDVSPIPGTDASDYRMLWSPDGLRIAFVRSRTNQILVVYADGSGQQSVLDNSKVYHGLAGWADSGHLVTTEPSPDGVVLQSLDLSTGLSASLFTISSNKADTVISADSRWIAYTTSLGGRLGNGLYVSHLDGTEPRLVAALDGRALYFPIWSPDDRWLILGLPDPQDPVYQTAQALVDLESCALIRLPDLGGDPFSFSWGP